tara:strand:+ start:116 stop:487 length:372 start_codon:yes stop_codon:yes gene_type:complete
MATTIKTYSYNGSTITDTSKGVRFTDGSVSPKNWETVWSDSYKNAKGITWTASTTYVGGSESAEKLAYLRQQRNELLEETDYLALSDVTMSDAWKTYRQQLRDITNSYQSIDEAGFAWPTKPS